MAGAVAALMQDAQTLAASISDPDAITREIADADMRVAEAKLAQAAAESAATVANNERDQAVKLCSVATVAADEAIAERDAAMRRVDEIAADAEQRIAELTTSAEQRIAEACAQRDAAREESVQALHRLRQDAAAEEARMRDELDTAVAARTRAEAERDNANHRADKLHTAQMNVITTVHEQRAADMAAQREDAARIRTEMRKDLDAARAELAELRKRIR
ncbi:hypothetical protein AWN90_39955 [Nocardia terpenica]|uniref:Uncharacterized protein n=2 Tax=Nocardia terpenica TaxID=455432 RepID=A0A164JUN6_9NOCA|nr:hypothetical protein AWN90_39955 [Nocardia terpenica]